MRVRYLLNILRKLGIGLLLGLVVSGCEPTLNEGVSIPNPPTKATARFSAEQPCVDSIDVMRRNHGRFLQHARNDTMYGGVRALQYSLKTCINCHVKADVAGNYPSIKKGTEHFCRSCHVYVAVSIDCFQCHANQPVESFAKIANNINPLNLSDLGTQTVSQ